MRLFFDSLVNLVDFIDLIDVRCPQCAYHAVVKHTGTTGARFICKNCGLTKAYKGKTATLGKACDPYFGYKLYYALPFKGNIVWFYNSRHLTYVKKYIQAQLRKRRKDAYGNRNTSLISRLPGFLKSRKNREKLEKVIAKIEKL
ncbi:MAG: hypothetical protein GF384_01295 [Elusimicrobia bacterium]|nr:hypothetical protein [Elusimicrobiota bacterium]